MRGAGCRRGGNRSGGDGKVAGRCFAGNDLRVGAIGDRGHRDDADQGSAWAAISGCDPVDIGRFRPPEYSAKKGDELSFPNGFNREYISVIEVLRGFTWA